VSNISMPVKLEMAMELALNIKGIVERELKGFSLGRLANGISFRRGFGECGNPTNFLRSCNLSFCA
jgi:hypothetical protein